MKVLVSTLFLAFAALCCVNALTPRALRGRTFDTDLGKLTFSEKNTGSYDERRRRGRFLVTSAKQRNGQFVLDGVWNEPGSGRCRSVPVENGKQSTNWGKLRFQFQIAPNGNYLKMRGKYSKCDAEPTLPWNGRLLPISQDLTGLLFLSNLGVIRFRRGNYASYDFNTGTIGPVVKNGGRLNKRTLVLESFWSEKIGSAPKCSSPGGPFLDKSRKWGKIRLVFELNKDGRISTFYGYQNYCNRTPPSRGNNLRLEGNTIDPSILK